MIRTATLFALAGPILLAGCGPTGPKIEKVPVPIPCVPASAIPAEPAFDRSTLNGNAVHDLDLVTAWALQLKDWGDRMHAALVSCSNIPPLPDPVPTPNP